MTSSKTHDTDEKVILPLIEEKPRLTKRSVSTGKVRIHTVIEHIEKTASATLREEHVEVTHVPMNQPVSEVPTARTVDGITIVPVLEEIMVVEKQLVLKEELHIRRRATTENVEIPVSLKKQRAVIVKRD